MSINEDLRRRAIEKINAMSDIFASTTEDETLTASFHMYIGAVEMARELDLLLDGEYADYIAMGSDLKNAVRLIQGRSNTRLKRAASEA